MKSSYPFQAIILNNRTVKISEIFSDKAEAKSEFEINTLRFIKDWLSNAQNFKLTTSGSTGEPKIITLNRKDMQLSAELTARALNLRKGLTALVCLNTQYIAGKMMLVRALVTGMRIIAVEPSSNPLKDLAEQYCPDFTAMVPLQLQTILHSDQKLYTRLNSFQCIIVGGGNLNEETKQKINKLSVPVYATYGMTETISHIALQRLNGSDADDFYTLLPGFKIMQDKRDCLLIKTPFSEEWITTNDIVQINSEGKLRWLGRWDNIINTGGIKVIPERIESEVEKLFKRLNIDQPFIVMGIPDKDLGEKVILLVEGEKFVPDLEVAILTTLRAGLDNYHTPKSILFTPDFVWTKTGKINRERTVNQIVTSLRKLHI